MTFEQRQARVRALEALDTRVKQFRGYEGIWPFRVPREPLVLNDLLEDLAVDPNSLRSRTVLSLEWSDGSRWELWTIALPSGVTVYCDSGADERRALASVRRGSPLEADGFFLELLAESRGAHFGIELFGSAPERVRSSIADRDFLTDVFVELFEGSEAESSIPRTTGEDFRDAVGRWLTGRLGEPARTAGSARRQLRRRDAQEGGP